MIGGVYSVWLYVVYNIHPTVSINLSRDVIKAKQAQLLLMTIQPRTWTWTESCETNTKQKPGNEYFQPWNSSGRWQPNNETPYHCRHQPPHHLSIKMTLYVSSGMINPAHLITDEPHRTILNNTRNKLAAMVYGLKTHTKSLHTNHAIQNTSDHQTA